MTWQTAAAAFLYSFVVAYFATRFAYFVRDMMR